MKPKLINGNQYKDQRGVLFYNNEFDATLVKRIYFIENKNTEIIRGWQGHKVEQRWINVVKGHFYIRLIKIDNWDFPSKNLNYKEFNISSKALDVLHIPKGYISCIQSKEYGSKLLVMSDYMLGEIDDDFRFALNYFSCMNTGY